MKNKYVLFVLAFVSIFVSSCSNKTKTRGEMVQEFRSQLTYNDTTAMLQLCDNAMELLKQNKIDEVISSLYIYDDSIKNVVSLSNSTAESYRKMFQLFPVLEYERDYYSFLYEGCNDVKYNVTFRNEIVSDSLRPLKTSYMFNPVKVNNEWKLCVKSAQDKTEKTINLIN